MPKSKKKSSAKTKLPSGKALIQLSVFDGTRQIFPRGKNLLIRISDGSQNRIVEDFFKESSLQFAVPFSANFKDNYTLLVSCDGYRDAGFFPVKVSPDVPAIVDLMLAPKKAKYDVLIQVDDSRLEKKDRTANEPIQFLVGRDKLRYEIVVNFVDKDRIRGYLSAPKDKALSAERPQFKPE